MFKMEEAVYKCQAKLEVVKNVLYLGMKYLRMGGQSEN